MLLPSSALINISVNHYPVPCIVSQNHAFQINALKIFKNQEDLLFVSRHISLHFQHSLLVFQYNYLLNFILLITNTAPAATTASTIAPAVAPIGDTSPVCTVC